MTVSTLSAMISRLTSEKCIPSWPIEMPSDTEIVPNSIGKPPASNTPSLTALASRSSDRLHGVISFHDDATPICDLAKSSSPMPTARSMPRAAAFSSPSVTSRERGLMSGADEPLARRESEPDEPLARGESETGESEGMGTIMRLAFRPAKRISIPRWGTSKVERWVRL